MNVMPILIRRELWEHRSLWIVPLAIAALIVVAAMFPHAANMQIDAADVATPQKYMDVFALFHSVLTIPQFLLLSVLLPYYLLDCLYAERKDRSILFWKALPVSDAQTVLSKLLVALAVVPLGVFVLTVFTDIAASGILAVRLRNSEMMRMFLRWDTEVWLHTQGLILGALVMVMLWYAPIAGYLLLVSAWAKRSAFLWAAMPPLVAMLIEKIAFGTSYVAKLLGYRMNGIWGTLGFSQGAAAKAAAAGEHAAGMLDRVRPLAALENIDLWLGLAVTVACVWLTIRIRRHQDDS
jgi:ABC-2 type transport system permease protein